VLSNNLGRGEKQFGKSIWDNIILSTDLRKSLVKTKKET
jgi:hypothetical protein